jgi:hypothetical protein
LTDPNGIQVRLMELVDQYLGENDNSKKAVILNI